VWLGACGVQPAPAQSGTGIITTLAGATPAGGAPVRGFGGDGGPGTSALLALANLQNDCGDPTRFEQTTHLAVDRSGNVYFADSNNQRIRRTTPQGTISTVAGNGERPPMNARCEPTGGGAAIGEGGPAAAARFVVVHPNGSLIVADQQNNRIRQFTPGGNITTIVGSGLHSFYAPGVPATTSGMDWPGSVAVDANGVLYFAEIHSHRVARVGADGRIVTIAGTGFAGFNGDNRPGPTAQLSNPAGIAVDAAGNLYIADQGNHRVRRVSPDGVITTIAGTGQAGFSGDEGRAEAAMLNQPTDVEVDGNNYVYLADMGNHRVRRISAGIITTVAGDGRSGRGPDNVAATASSLNFPAGGAVDASGDLYIVDWQNYLIRKVSFSGRPLISAGGVVNGASFAPAPIPVASGSILSIFGANLAAAVASAAEVPLPTELAGTTVRINGVPAPLFFVSPGQINVQLPFEIAAGTATAVASTSGGSSAAESFNVAQTAPGVFQFSGTNRAVVLNQDGSVNTPDNPEARGRIIVAFLTGQGPVSPRVPSGQAAAADPLSRATQAASARIGGAAAQVVFLGLTPSFVGLCQANIEVPMSSTTGTEVPMFITVGGQSSNTATVSIR